MLTPPIRPPPLPAPSLDYFRPGIDTGPANWLTLTIVPTVSQWHQTRAALTRAHIECRMDEGIPVVIDKKGRSMQSVAILIPESDLPRAAAILAALKTGRHWCPACGSMELRKLPVSAWWWIFSLPFLGVAPFSPPRFECVNCGNKWE